MQMTDPRRPPDDPPPTLEYIGIAPAWRIIALVAVLTATLLLFIVIMLLIGLARSGIQPSLVTVPPPAPFGVGGVGAVMGAAPDLEDEPGAAGAHLPYPTTQDLRPKGTFPVPGEEAEPRPGPTSRGELLRHAQSIWSNADGRSPGRVLVSPDGSFFAYHNGSNLMAGIAGSLTAVIEEEGWANAGFGMPGVGMGMAGPAGAGRLAWVGQRLSPSGWSIDGTRVYWADAAGRIVSYDAKQRRFFRTPLLGEAAIPVANTGNYIVLRSRPRTKVEAAGRAIRKDPTEVQVVDNNGAVVRTLLVDDAVWRLAAVSADGARLALISNKGQESVAPMRWQVFVLDLAADKPVPRPVGAPAQRLESVCWTPDGTLICARSQVPTPLDHLRIGPPTDNTPCDLFEIDPMTGKETRLTRGGGFSSPTVTREKDLWFVVETGQAGGTAVQLMRMPLRAVQEFLEQEAADAARVAATWKALTDHVFTEAGLALEGPGLTAEACAKADTAFRKAYLNHLKDKPPTGVAGMERLRQDAATAGLADADQKRLEVLLGVIEGEFLRRCNVGSNWHLGKGPLVAKVSATEESLFGVVYNPFRPLRSPGAEMPTLSQVLFRAAGRPLVLGNDLLVAKERLGRMGDADLERIDLLLTQDKDEEADRLTRELLKRHQPNFTLTVHVGELLYRHGRLDVLREVLQKHAALPPNARLHNLLGVALLPGDKVAAIREFQDALRCDLDYGSAYLNLAQAYQESGQPDNARLCLRRYLKLKPEGDLAFDARRRLAHVDNGAVPGAP